MSGWETAKEVGLGVLDVAEMAAGEIPLVGTLTHGLEAIGNESDKMAAKRAGLDDPENLAKYQEADAKQSVNMLEAIPAFGTGFGAVDIYSQINKHFTGDPDITDKMKENLYPPGAPATPGGPATPAPIPEPAPMPWDFPYGGG